MVEAGEALAIADQPVSQDIISAKVTRVASGVSQVEVVLNNQRHSAEHRPLVPTWRYNGLDPVSFGTRMRVDYRYGNEPWTPMILARVTDIAFLFPQAAGAQVTLQGEDLLSLLKAKPAQDTLYSNQHEVDIVRSAVSTSGASLSVRATAPTPAFRPRWPASPTRAPTPICSSSSRSPSAWTTKPMSISTTPRPAAAQAR